MQGTLPELMTVLELKDYLKCGRDTAYSTVRRKDFPSIRIGRIYYVIKDKLPEWIEKQSKKAVK
jgi:excisionase family DNA binding protein